MADGLMRHRASARARRTIHGRLVVPMRKRSHSRAAPRPSLIAQTTRLWPRRQSPAAKMPGTLVGKLAILRLGVGAGITLDAELGQNRVFRPQKTHGQQDQIGFQNFIRAGTRLGINAPCSFLVHSTS